MKNFTTTYLRQKRKQLLKQLQAIKTPILRGSLIERYKQCGKDNCHCVDGKGHGPTYYLSVSMPGARPILLYVPSEHKTFIETALINYRKAQQILDNISDINRELFRRKAAF